MTQSSPATDDPLLRTLSEGVGGPPGRRSRGHPWWTPVRVLLAVTTVVWVLALVQKLPCVADHWSGDATRYSHACYSDMPYLYVGRGFAEGVLPYGDNGDRYPDLEYPVLLGLVAWAGAVVDQHLVGDGDTASRRVLPVSELSADHVVEDERRAFLEVNFVLLAPLVLLATWFLAGAHRGRPWDALPFAASPALVLTGLINWDVVAVTCVAGAFWAWSRGRAGLTGVMLGLGVAAKLYPLYLFGAFLVVAIRRRRLPDIGFAALTGTLTWLVVNVPFMVRDLEAWKAFWTFNVERGADLGSLWLIASNAGHPPSLHTVNTVSALVFAAVCLGVLALGLLARETPRVAQLALLVLVGFLVVNKVYSPQYVLWLLPVAVLARPRWRDLLVWQATEAVYFLAVWWYLGGFTASAATGAPDPAYAVATAVRVAGELYLAAVVVRDVLRPEHDPVRRQPAADEPLPLETTVR